MSYHIRITATAERDIVQAIDYIEFNLKNPDAATHLLDLITEQINSLADFPEKSALVDDPVLSTCGIRFITIGHYLAFYIIDKENLSIIVVRFLYQKRNWISILRQETTLN